MEMDTNLHDTESGHNDPPSTETCLLSLPYEVLELILQVITASYLKQYM